MMVIKIFDKINDLDTNFFFLFIYLFFIILLFPLAVVKEKIDASKVDSN